MVLFAFLLLLFLILLRGKALFRNIRFGFLDVNYNTFL